MDTSETRIKMRVKAVKTVLKIVCMYCEAFMGERDGLGVEGISHSICEKCWEARHPDIPYPVDEED